MSECAERAVREYPADLWRGRTGDTGVLVVPLSVNRPAGQEIRSPVIPGLVGNRSRGLTVRYCTGPGGS